MTRKFLSFIFLSLSLLFLSASLSFAQAPHLPKTDYLKGKVVKIVAEGERDTLGVKSPFQKVLIHMIDGDDKNQDLTIVNGGTVSITPAQKVSVGETVILSKTAYNGKATYTIIDTYRLTPLILILVFFFLFVLVLAGRKGFGAILGMFISLAVILFFIVPQIMSGSDPIFISIVGSIGIMIVTIYLAHGISQQTSVAVGSTAVSLVITGVCAILFVKLLHLTGLGSEDIYSLQQNLGNSFNYQGLLLGGIIIGALGALDDVTTTQSTTIYTLSKADPKATMQELIKHGFSIGKEHIASLVNTLVLAYAGASIGIFFFLVISQQQHIQPLWVILNSELIIEEIVRTLAGSIGLILAVPLTTVIAAFFAKYDVKIH